MKANPIKIFWLALGLLCLALGTLGIALPILPTVPLYMATLFCFAKSSKRLHDWFLGTGLYKKHLKSFAESKSMTMKTKLSIVCTVTAVMAFGFIMMKNVPVGRVVMTIVWVFHLIYFFVRIKTIPNKREEASDV